jgi:hypothetical protein
LYPLACMHGDKVLTNLCVDIQVCDRKKILAEGGDCLTCVCLRILDAGMRWALPTPLLLA